MKCAMWRLGLAVMTVRLVVVGLPSPRAEASQVLFTFAGQNATFGGALTSLNLTESGLTLSLARENGARFDVDQNVGFPASWGTRSLSPFFDTSSAAFIGNFSQSLTSVSIDMGDFGADTDNLLLQAYSGPNATGTLQGTASAALIEGGSAFSFLTVSAAAGGINIDPVHRGLPQLPQLGLL